MAEKILSSFSHRTDYTVSYRQEPFDGRVWDASYSNIMTVDSPEQTQMLASEYCDEYAQNFDWYNPNDLLTERPFLLYMNEFVIPTTPTEVRFACGFKERTFTTTSRWDSERGFGQEDREYYAGTNQDTVQLEDPTPVKNNGSPELFNIFTGEVPEYAFESGTFYDFFNDETPTGYLGTTIYHAHFSLPVFNKNQAKAIYLYLLNGDILDAMNYDDIKPKDEDDDGRDDGGGTDPTNDNESANNRPHETNVTPLNCAGAMNPYAITTGQLTNVFQWFWNGMTNQLEEDNFLKYVLQAYGDLRKNIVSVRVYPFDAPASVVKPLVLGRFVNDNFNLSSLDASKQLVVTFTGKVARKHGSFLDFAPYTNVSVYLPYYGTVPLPTNVVMGNTIECDYYVDFTTGSCDIFVLVVSSNGGNRLIQHLTCTVGMDVFYDLDSGYSSNDIVHNFGINIVKDEVASAVKGVGSGASMSGNPILMGAGAIGSLAGDVANKVPDLPTTQDNIQSSLGSNGLVGCWSEEAYILYERPNIVSPSKSGQENYKGYVCMKNTHPLSAYDGYIEVDNPRITFDKTVITASEEIELYRLLSSGVYMKKG